MGYTWPNKTNKFSMGHICPKRDEKVRKGTSRQISLRVALLTCNYDFVYKANSNILLVQFDS